MTADDGTARRSRTAIPRAVQVRVFRRDGWLCRWCGRPVIFAPAMKYLERLARRSGHAGPLAYYDPRWRRDAAPLLDHLGAVIDHVAAFARGGSHDEANFVTACNKCNASKNADGAANFAQRSPLRIVKGKYGEPAAWDGLSTLFLILAAQDPGGLIASERQWAAALGGPLGSIDGASSGPAR